MVATVDAERDRTVSLLERWVDQNSGTMNRAGVSAVRDMVEPEFRQLGFKTEWIDMSGSDRAGHLVARHTGSRRGKRLLLIAARQQLIRLVPSLLLVCLTTPRKL